MSAEPRHFQGWRFWVTTLAALATAAATTSLGLWQLSRADQKTRLEAVVEAKKVLPPLTESMLAAMKNAADNLHTPVSLRGHWLSTATVYLDNRQMNGRPGFYVLTPLQLQGQTKAVVVQRGWVPRNFLHRAQLPVVETPEGLVSVNGRLAPPPSRLLEFAANAASASASATPSTAEGQGSSTIRQNLVLADLAASTGLPLATDYTVLETGAASQGLLRDWPQAASGVGKHYGYAFQWFGLAGLVTTLYVWFQLITPWRRRRHAPRDAV